LFTLALHASCQSRIVTISLWNRVCTSLSQLSQRL